MKSRIKWAVHVERTNEENREEEEEEEGRESRGILRGRGQEKGGPI